MSGERGGIVAEVAVLAPLLVLFMVFVVYAGRVGQAQQDVAQAAAEAARVASLTRTADAGEGAQHIARSNLTAAGVRCRDLAVEVGTAQLHPGGSVAVEIRCAVDLRGVAGPGMPRTSVVTARAVEVIDTYRGGE